MRILFRTEGHHRQGMGDVWGCLALAACCSTEADAVCFVVSAGTEAAAFVSARGYAVQEVASLQGEQAALRAFHPDVVVVNKLANPPGYIRWLTSLVGLVVTMDDAGDEAQAADLRINGLYHTANAMTDVAYIPLRSEFVTRHAEQKVIRMHPEELLITQGGSDTYGFTPRIIQALTSMTSRLHCTVVLGPAFRHERELEQALDASVLNVSVVRCAERMDALMSHADLAVTAGGLTLCELACTGTPSLVVCAEAFELETARRLEGAGTSRVLGFGGELDYRLVPEAVDRLCADVEARARMSRCGKALIDGRGGERIIRLIQDQLLVAEGRRR